MVTHNSKEAASNPVSNECLLACLNESTRFKKTKYDRSVDKI